MSSIFVVESYRLDGKAMRVTFNEGVLTKTEKLKCIDNRHGLFTYFIPSSILGEITSSVDDVGNLLWELCHFYPLGTTITYNSIDYNGDKKKVVIKNTKGLNAFLERICEKPLIQPIVISDNNGTNAIDILLTYDLANMNDPLIVASVNMCHTTSFGSTHVDGVMDALTRFFRDYMNKVYLASSKNKKLQIIAQDIRTGLRAVISAKSLFPLYTGQSKEVYSEVGMKSYAFNITYKAISEWAKTNPTELQHIGKYLKNICEIRSSIDNQKIKLQNNYTASVISGLPAKYKKPNGKLKELIIVEGDSAVGGMENNRDKFSQGLFPIQGKISNAVTTPIKKFFENPEIAGMFKIMGYNGYSKQFDPNLFKPEKVIIASDADSDGSHIESLILMMFLRYLPFVIEQGKLYAANPPLYGLSLGGGKMKYFFNTIEYLEYAQSIFLKSNAIMNFNTKKALSKNDIVRLLYNNIDYTLFLNHVSSIYSIDPYFLEFLLYNRNLSFREFKKTIEKSYRFVSVEKQNQTILIRGLVGSLYQTVFFDDRLLNSCKQVIDLIDKSEKYYILNGQVTSLYGIMNTFDSTQPSGITRYKGYYI